ncbi:hypothetical protein [Nitrososphaera sp.]|uniref:hypothetical protein n=1 Tax=Nitrososphaera sp. TaxID=1971748 RepID=UPI00307F036A
MNKFALVIIGIAGAMAALIAASYALQQPAGKDGLVELEYTKQQMTMRDGSGEFVAGRTEVLTIAKDGSATYRLTDPAFLSQPQEKKFSLSSEEKGRLKGLILETGFMQIPDTDYPQKAGVANFTSYTLKATAVEGGESKTLKWVNQQARDGTIPPIILQVNSQLDSIMSKVRA